jgi:hypothetical protein
MLPLNNTALCNFTIFIAQPDVFVKLFLAINHKMWYNKAQVVQNTICRRRTKEVAPVSPKA